MPLRHAVIVLNDSIFTLSAFKTSSGANLVGSPVSARSVVIIDPWIWRNRDRKEHGSEHKQSWLVVYREINIAFLDRDH